jgi:hypothetical protein
MSGVKAPRFSVTGCRSSQGRLTVNAWKLHRGWKFKKEVSLAEIVAIGCMLIAYFSLTAQDRALENEQAGTRDQVREIRQLYEQVRTQNAEIQAEVVRSTERETRRLMAEADLHRSTSKIVQIFLSLHDSAEAEIHSAQTSAALGLLVLAGRARDANGASDADLMQALMDVQSTEMAVVQVAETYRTRNKESIARLRLANDERSKGLRPEDVLASESKFGEEIKAYYIEANALLKRDVEAVARSRNAALEKLVQHVKQLREGTRNPVGADTAHTPK